LPVVQHLDQNQQHFTFHLITT